MDRPLMKCGHTAMATHEVNGKTEPCCAICAGLKEGWDQVDNNVPDLTGRIARCGYGAHADVPSRFDLPFFEHRPDEEFDSYYCGCFGWD